MSQPALRFYRHGRIVTLTGVDHHRTLLDLLREDLHCSGTKEGCGEGDCGACTVVLAEEQNGVLKFSAVNSCIRLAHSINAMALWTVEDLAQSDGTLHPVQQALVQCHASQCGFCTPGFAMSLFGLYQTLGKSDKDQPVTREQAQIALSGNLCRCTGYRPLLDAAQTMQKLPAQRINEAEILAALRSMAETLEATETAETAGSVNAASAYLAPTTLQKLLQDRKEHPKAQLVAGTTDVGLWINKLHMQFTQFLDVTRVRELRQIERYENHIAIGAAATLTNAFEVLCDERPQLAEFAQRFAGLPVRNAGTLGGNVANGSPIGDSMPLLIALGAHVILMRADQPSHRTLALEDFYTGYRKNRLLADEVVAWILVPRPRAGEVLRAYKVSKRREDDISAVCLSVQLHVEPADNGVVTHVSIGVGGVAATPVRARATEAALRGQVWNEANVRRAMEILRAEFAPISDMRASAEYRRLVLGNLLQRFWLESQGHACASLEQLDLQPIAAREIAL